MAYFHALGDLADCAPLYVASVLRGSGRRLVPASRLEEELESICVPGGASVDVGLTQCRRVLNRSGSRRHTGRQTFPDRGGRGGEFPDRSFQTMPSVGTEKFRVRTTARSAIDRLNSPVRD